eukprot:IDg14494t1
MRAVSLSALPTPRNAVCVKNTCAVPPARRHRPV